MKRLIIYILLISITGLLSAQVAIDWTVMAGAESEDLGYSVATDTNGNSYVTGCFQNTVSFGTTQLTSSGFKDVFIAKMNSNGNWLWAKKTGGNVNDYGYSICTDNSGNCYVTGYFQGTALFGTTSLTSSGVQDVFITKLDTDGNWLWAVKAGGTANDNGYGILADNSGNCFVTGFFRGSAYFGTTNVSANGGNEIFITKLDTNGSWSWVAQAGGISDDQGLAITQDTSGNCYLTGSFMNIATLGTITLTSYGNTDSFVAKVNPDGNWVWAIKAGGVGGDVGYGVQIDANGALYTTGNFANDALFGTELLTSSGSFDVYVAKLDLDGNWVWARSAGGTGLDYSYGIAIDNDGNSFITGSFSLTAYFGTNVLESLSSITSDIYVAALDANGSWLWAVSEGGTDIDVGRGIAADNGGNLYFVGSFKGTAYFGDTPLVSNGNADVFVARFHMQTGSSQPLPPEHVTVTPDSDNMNLQWDPVTQDINGATITPDGYRIYFCPDADHNSFSFCDQVVTNTYVHIGAGVLPQGFYIITAVCGE